MIVFLTHKINPKVFCPNFGVHFIPMLLLYIIQNQHPLFSFLFSNRGGVKSTDVGETCHSKR